MRYAYGVTAALLIGGATLSLMTGFPAGAQVAQNDASKLNDVLPRGAAQTSFAPLVKQLQPAVVYIATRQRVQVEPDAISQFFGATPQTRQAGALGSGFIISPDGYVVTNNHVVTLNNQGVADSITVKLPDGSDYTARIVGRDQQSDIAVLKIDAKKPLPYVEFGDSAKSQAGDWVLVIGNPFGLGGTVTAGIISSVFRNTGTGAYDHYIQTDASINSGNSGGPMFDMHGQVIGINTWIVSPSGGNVGIGFAIPSDIAKPIVEKLKNGMAIQRGFLGLTPQPIDDDMADSLNLPHNRGELIQSVLPGKGAALAGIEAGDIITRIDGKDISPDNTVSTVIANTEPGSKVRVTVLRSGKTIELTATVGKRPSDADLAKINLASEDTDQQAQQSDQQASPDKEGPVEKSLGLAVTALTPQNAPRLGLPAATRGLVIVGVDPSSDAALKGLKPYIVILEAGGRPTNTKADLEAAVRAAIASGREAVQLRVQVPGSPSGYIAVRLLRPAPK